MIKVKRKMQQQLFPMKARHKCTKCAVVFEYIQGVLEKYVIIVEIKESS